MKKNEIIAEIMFKIGKIPTSTVNRLAVNELIPFDQIEPFHTLAITIEADVLDALAALQTK
jgi:hypothetical protein